MNPSHLELLFAGSIGAHALLILGAAWSIALPHRRIYPLRSKNVIYYLMWALFYLIFASNLAIAIADWNGGVWTSDARYIVGATLLVLGTCLFWWGFRTLGVKNTSCIRDRFISSGAYAVCRNPQYLGDMLIFAGVTIISNSGLVLVSHTLTAVVFILATLAEESWLSEQYGDEYSTYRQWSPRFL